MPGLNGRGPQGQGPLTGRRLGRCSAGVRNAQAAKAAPNMRPGAGGNQPGRAAGYGIGQGRGRGQGLRQRIRAWWQG